MDPKIIKSETLHEDYQVIKHSSGLDIILYPMPEYSSAYALFATKYGSVDTTFKTDTDQDFVTVPEGIAHFLEHKLFENEAGEDAFARYAQTGASANAFTSFDRTAYLFSCTDNFKESLEILLDFVTDPFFSAETVQKEQGIIAQEIKMYEDDPDWRVFFNMLGAMYPDNPVSIDIAGTVDSISQIDADLLYRCYHTFYNLNNMALVISGNFDVQEVIELADDILKPAKEISIERKFPEHQQSVKQEYVEQEFSVSLPIFNLGFKKATAGDAQDFIDAAKTRILLEMIAGDASKLYRNLYDSGLINDTFSASPDTGRGYAYSSFNGESKDPKAVKDAIIKEIDRFKADGLDSESFKHCKKSVWGSIISIYGNVNAVAMIALNSHFVGLDAYAMLDAVSNTTLEELEEILHRDFESNLCSLSVVVPKK